MAIQPSRRDSQWVKYFKLVILKIPNMRFRSVIEPVTYSGSWNVSVVVDFLRNHHSADLTIPELGKKVVTLTALANTAGVLI